MHKLKIGFAPQCAPEADTEVQASQNASVTNHIAN
jgi:hypothetical protein